MILVRPLDIWSARVCMFDTVKSWFSEDDIADAQSCGSNYHGTAISHDQTVSAASAPNNMGSIEVKSFSSENRSQSIPTLARYSTR